MIVMQITKGQTTDEILEIYPEDPESSTCSFRCHNPACKERIWLYDCYSRWNKSLIECPYCGRLHVVPYLRREDLE